MSDKENVSPVPEAATAEPPTEPEAKEAEETDVPPAKPPSKKELAAQERARLREAKAKVKELVDARKRVAAEKKRLQAMKPPPDVKISVPEKEEVDTDDETSSIDDDDARSFARSLRDYMDVYVAESMKRYRDDAAAAAAEDERRMAESHATFEAPPEPKKMRPSREAVAERARPAIFFA